jgi:hypothetical protein
MAGPRGARTRAAYVFMVSTTAAAAWGAAVAVVLLAGGDANAIELPASAATPRYADGAPPGFSGGFGEQSCHACHFHGELNSGPGRLALDGVPERFAAGQQYPLTITLSRTGMTLAGFQLTARRKDGGAQAGTLAPSAADAARVKVDVQGGIQYVNQQRDGAELAASSTARWSVVWTAPDGGGPVQFHVSANAADKDESVNGDYVHTVVVDAQPAQP